jgi:serine/threonine-protein kinase
MPTEASMSTFSDDDRYEILRPIGEGSMGIVSEARDHALGRVVALKSLHPRLANKKGFLDRFVQEAKLSGQLDHPGIIPV